MTEAAVSLYFDLEPGQVADLEVVARAALAWSATIKEMAYIIDPSLEVRVEVASGTRSSFSLNSVIRALHRHFESAKGDPLTLRAILIGLAIHFGWETIDFAYAKLLESPEVHSSQEIDISPESLDELERRVERATTAGLAAQHARQVFREAERDPAIKGLGVSIEPGQRPEFVIPREQFAARAGHGQIREETVRRRIVPDRERVVLIKPVLVPGNRHWSLRTAEGEFGFTIKDTDFVERVLSGTTAIPMIAGIEMDVETETAQEFKDGVWVVTDRRVIRVLDLHRPERQSVLSLPPREDDEPRHNDN